MSDELGKVIDKEGRGMSRSALALGLTAVAMGTCALAVQGVNFLIGCSERNLTIIAMGFRPDTLARCIKYTPDLVWALLGIK